VGAGIGGRVIEGFGIDYQCAGIVFAGPAERHYQESKYNSFISTYIGHEIG
jgi:hypothetical protein